MGVLCEKGKLLVSVYANDIFILGYTQRSRGSFYVMGILCTMGTSFNPQF